MAISSEWLDIRNDTSHQSSTVASDAQVPGPGRNRPMPKNVAMIQAHPVWLDAVLPALVAFVFIAIGLSV
jgi:hypothetical protein